MASDMPEWDRNSRIGESKNGTQTNEAGQPEATDTGAQVPLNLNPALLKSPH